MDGPGEPGGIQWPVDHPTAIAESGDGRYHPRGTRESPSETYGPVSLGGLDEIDYHAWWGG